MTDRSCRLPSVAGRSRDERGQAAVELALALPLIVMFVLGALQVGLVARDQLAVEYAAREAARAAAVSADPSGAAAAAARRVTTLAPLDVSTSVDGDVVRVRVRYVSATDVALVGAAIGDVTLEATAAMAWEPPSQRPHALHRSVTCCRSVSCGACAAVTLRRRLTLQGERDRQYRGPVPLGVSSSLVDGRPVLALSGRLDLGSIPALHNALTVAIVDNPAATIAVDLAAVEAVDDVALGVLLGAAGRTRRGGGDLVVVTADQELRRYLALTGFDRAVQVGASLSS